MTFLSVELGQAAASATRIAPTRPSALHSESSQPRARALEDRTVPSTLTVPVSATAARGHCGRKSPPPAAATRSSSPTVSTAKRSHWPASWSSARAWTSKEPGAAKLTVSGNNTTRVFDIQNGATVTLAGLTIANGRAGSPDPALAGDGGGGIENEAGATLRLSDDTITNNTAYGVGGGVWNRIGANVSVNNSVFSGNNAFGSLNFNEPAEGFSPGDGTTEGGAIENDGTATVRNSTFTDNLAQGATGGAVGGAHGGAITANGSLTVTGSVFTDNTARGGAGSSGGRVPLAAAAVRRRAAPLRFPAR